MQGKLMKFILKSPNKMKEHETTVRNRKEARISHDDAAVHTYAVTDLFVPINEVGTHKLENQIKMDELKRLAMFEKKHKLHYKRKYDKEVYGQEKEKKIDPLNFFLFVNEIKENKSTNVLEELNEGTEGNSIETKEDSEFMIKNSQVHIEPISLDFKQIKMKIRNTSNIAFKYFIYIKYEQVRRFYRKLSHNSSCELFKHFKNNVYVSSLKLNSEENTLPESQTKSNQQPFSVSTCALRYVKMDSPTDICRNKIQIKYKTNDNTGLITIVESLHNPIDHVLLGKLICHLLGIESLNENQSPK